MEPVTENHASHLFIVRVWQDQAALGDSGFRFHVKHILSDEERLFRSGAEMLAFIQSVSARTPVIDASE